MKKILFAAICIMLTLVLVGPFPPLKVQALGNNAEKYSASFLQSRNLIFPGTGTWYICQGFNTKEITHTGKLKYSIDLTTDPASVTSGNYGCNGNNKAASGKLITAPTNGTIYYLSTRTDMINFQLDSGGCYQIGHLSSRAPAVHVTSGSYVGTLAAPATENGNYSHLHIEAFSSSCASISEATAVGFSDSSNFRFYGGPDLPATSTIWAYRKTSITQSIPNSQPAAASNLTVTGVSTSSVRLNWSDNSSNETGFKIYNNNNFITTASANSTTFSFTSLSAGSTYCFQVSAYNSSGESSKTSVACGSTFSNGTSPYAPSNLSVTGVSTSSVRLNWSDNSSNESGFKIYNNNNWITTPPINSTTYTITGLSAGSSYCFQISAYNSYGESSRTSSVCGSTFSNGTSPYAPGNLSVTGTSTSSVRLDWSDNSSNETGFKIYNNNNWIATPSINSTNYTFTGLSAGSTYCFQISAYNSYGESSRTNVVCGSTSSTGSSNFALNKPAYATSSESSSYLPAKGNDGNFGTRWSSGISSTLGTQNYFVDFGSSQTFNQYVITWENAYAARFYVIWSSDCVNFYYDGVTYSRGSAGTSTITISQQTARCVGIQMIQRAPYMNNYSLYEFEVYKR